MPTYPEHLLSPGEHVVSEFRPHWSRVLRELLILALTIALAAIIVLTFIPDSWQWWVVLGVILMAAFVTIPNIVRWRFSQYIITNERVITRSGVISREGKEIPLEVINDVGFTQSVFERIFRTGDLLVESAGEFGQNRYADVPRPEQIQTAIYKVREERILELRGGGAPVPQAPAPASAGATAAEQLAILSKLHDDGKLTDAEFESQKAQLLGGGSD